MCVWVHVFEHVCTSSYVCIHLGLYVCVHVCVLFVGAEFDVMYILVSAVLMIPVHVYQLSTHETRELKHLWDVILNRALHLAIIHNHQDVVLQLLDVLPQLPPTETPVVDCLNNLKQVRGNLSVGLSICKYRKLKLL